MFGWPSWLILTVEVVLTIVVTVVLAHFSKRIIKRLLKWDINPIPATTIFINIARFAIYVAGLAIILNFAGIDPSAVVTALGVGGIAVSLGLQDTIANLVSGLQLSLARIITPGEFVKIGDQVGVVKDITWRSTTITTKAGETITIPNAVMNKNSVSHLPEPLGTETRVDFVLPLSSDLEAQSEHIARIAKDALENVIVRGSQVEVLFSSITDRGIHGSVVAQTKPTTKAGTGSDLIVRAIASEVDFQHGSSKPHQVVES